MFRYSCKIFGLRVSNDHRELEVSQFSIGTDENGKFIFFGRVCKNWQEGCISGRSNLSLKTSLTLAFLMIIIGSIMIRELTMLEANCNASIYTHTK